MPLLEITLGSLIILAVAAFTLWFIRWVSLVDAAEFAQQASPSLTVFSHPGTVREPSIPTPPPEPTIEPELTESRELVPA
ncbi:MAG: hypothetical protein AAF089_05455 [Bacteroidota bacterium]